jgi:hypothetical protein
MQTHDLLAVELFGFLAETDGHSQEKYWVLVKKKERSFLVLFLVAFSMFARMRLPQHLRFGDKD